MIAVLLIMSFSGFGLYGIATTLNRDARAKLMTPYFILSPALFLVKDGVVAFFLLLFFVFGASTIAEFKRKKLVKEYVEKLKRNPDDWYTYDSMRYLHEGDLADEICKEAKRKIKGKG